MVKRRETDPQTSAADRGRPIGPEGEQPETVSSVREREKSAGIGALLFSERSVFALCCVIVLAHFVISLFFSPDIYRDVARCYAWYAREYSRGVWHDVPISFLPPLSIFLAGKLSMLGIEAYAAVKIVSVTFFALTLIPVYWMLKFMGEDKTARWGCLLFISAPRLLRYSGMALLEPVRDFFLVSAVCLLIKGWKKGINLTDSLLLGASLGLMSLARAEGVVLAFFIFCARCYLPKGSRTVRNLLRSVIPTAIMTIVVLLPVLVKNYNLTGYPVIDQRMNHVLASCPGINKLFTPREFAVENLAKSGWLGSGDCEKTAEPEADVTPAPVERLMLLPKKIFKGSYEVYICLAFLGMLVLALRRKWKVEHTFLLAYCLITPIPFIFFSVSSRYFVYFIPLLLVFVINGLGFLWEYAVRFHLRPVAIAGLAALFAAQIYNPWSYILRSEGGESLRMAEFIRANRARFNPLNRPKMILYGNDAVVYYCDEARLAEYAQHVEPFDKVTGFDVLILDSVDDEVKICAERKDLLRVESPEKEFVLFIPNRSGGSL